MRIRVLLVAFLLAMTGCSDDGSDGSDGSDDTEPAETLSEGVDPNTSNAAANEAEPLPVGKDDLPLEPGQSYLSPEGFLPALRIDLAQGGWTSVHRDTDGFDLGQADPDADAPLVAVAFLVPTEETAEAALAAVRQRAESAGGRIKELTDPLGPLGATGVDVRGGEGALVASRDGGIALDAVPDGRVQVWAADVGGAPVLVVVFVPDATLFGATAGAVQQLLGSVSPA